MALIVWRQTISIPRHCYGKLQAIREKGSQAHAQPIILSSLILTPEQPMLPLLYNWVGFWNLTIEVKIQRRAKLLISDGKVDFRYQARFKRSAFIAPYTMKIRQI